MARSARYIPTRVTAPRPIRAPRLRLEPFAEAHLTARYVAWLNDPDACTRVAKAGHGVVQKLGGALDRTLVSLDPYLMQLQLHQRSRHA